MERSQQHRLATSWRLWIWLFGLGLLWIGYLEHSLAIRSLAVIVILLRVIPVSGGTRTYARRVYKIRNDCLLAIRQSTSRYGQWAGRHRRSLELLSVPESMEPLRQALLRSLIDPLDDGPASQLTGTAVPRRQAMLQLADALKARDRAGAEREFLRYAKNWWAAANQRLLELYQDSERLMSAAMAELKELRPPLTLQGPHQSLEVGLRDEYVAWASFCRALINLDPPAAIAAAGELEPARAQIRQATKAVLHSASGRVRQRTVWPAGGAGAA
jgi:hypothetical protein